MQNITDQSRFFAPQHQSRLLWLQYRWRPHDVAPLAGDGRRHWPRTIGHHFLWRKRRVPPGSHRAHVARGRRAAFSRFSARAPSRAESRRWSRRVCGLVPKFRQSSCSALLEIRTTHRAASHLPRSTCRWSVTSKTCAPWSNSFEVCRRFSLGLGLTESATQNFQFHFLHRVWR